MNTDELELLFNEESYIYEKWKINFGKHNGKTYKVIYETDKPYFNWLLKLDNLDERVKKVLKLKKALQQKQILAELSKI